MDSSAVLLPTGKFIQAGPVRLHCLDMGGDDRDRVLVFLHGSGPGNSAYANFSKNKESFLTAGYRVILVDLVGFGFSDKPLNLGGYTLDLFCDTLLAGLKTLGVEKCSFIGNSLGAGIAIQIALNRPNLVEKLILMGPGCLEPQADYFEMPGIAKMMSANKSGLTRESLAATLRLFTYDKKNVTDDLVEMRWRIAKDQPKEVLTTMKTPNLGPRMQELECPILTFWGADDQFMPSAGKEKCLRANAHSRLIEINACGHWVMIEHSEMFNRSSLDFLEHG